ncbi:DNA (cytosine-5-)-methyltransferase [Clostridium sp.]|uniref:DNA (cytosine-5-)-methyltransferase n=1 Tax=Clostridium sp. TaxID=1506 RepID=UPI00290EF5F5|nr:DNA (cytosine-5-)-methyltransferase [Clostridium sp.]MDU3410013.1 DNA (cytosine-5-)-methyltransferase [Clostridium sp.]
MIDKLRVLECFAGVGSQSMALRNIGVNYEVVGIMEIDKHALVGYSAIHKDLIDNIPAVSDDYMYNYLRKKEVGTNFSTGKNELPKKGEKLRQIYLADMKTNNLGDISLVNVNDIPDHDFMTYSFPCKNISNEGKQDGFEEGSGTQSSLVWECKKIIESKKPKFLMMENVKNIVSKVHKSYFDSWCNWLTSMGYKNYWKIYNGNDFGVAQSRERVIMISIKEEICNRINFTEPNSNGKKQKLIDIVDYSTLEDYLIDINSLEGFVEIIDNNLLNGIRNKIIDEGILFTNKESKEIIERRNKYLPLYSDLNNSSLIVREATKIGYKVAEVGDSINLSQKNSKTRRGRVGKEEAKTLTTACEQAIVLDGYKIKKLSPLEAWRLQGFSDGDYYKAEKAGIPKINLYERAGRGIVVPMLEEIFKCLFKEYIVKN